ncbi:TspO/MBR family protein [Gregarina niphandrodes]|uniref:TspO/MBR family protein n=1 Tax=Gregarina niphandrodes TaxID=110365 RepID=A0A023B869_GRENI|nr:TspO/MBR family protein [Gregarina niphandrodes]EZG68222.1 TspO/MBR family protein [Gregarina niphandrodes]|eukprot:XP_011130024.1 TspO/MBR family protein [Gregarina niphandrodes]
MAALNNYPRSAMLGAFIAVNYVVSRWMGSLMKYGVLARIASPIAGPLLTGICISSALSGWLGWKQGLRMESYIWQGVLALMWTVSFFALHSTWLSVIIASFAVVAVLFTMRSFRGHHASILMTPQLLWTIAMLLMNAGFCAFRLGFLSFGGLQWWGLKTVGMGLFHTAQHLLLH